MTDSKTSTTGPDMSKTTAHTAELNEPELPDDYPIYGDYLYVADGKVVRSDWHGITAERFKRHLGAKELRRCDIAGRAAISRAEGR